MKMPNSLYLKVILILNNDYFTMWRKITLVNKKTACFMYIQYKWLTSCDDTYLIADPQWRANTEGVFFAFFPNIQMRMHSFWDLPCCR